MKETKILTPNFEKEIGEVFIDAKHFFDMYDINPELANSLLKKILAGGFIVILTTPQLIFFSMKKRLQETDLYRKNSICILALDRTKKSGNDHADYHLNMKVTLPIYSSTTLWRNDAE